MPNFPRTALAPYVAAFWVAAFGWDQVRRAEAQEALSPQTVVVTTDQAPLQDGPKLLARVRQGARLNVVETNGEWLKIAIPNQSRYGWIHRKFVQTKVSNKAAPLTQTDKERLAAEAKALRAQANQLWEEGEKQAVIALNQKAVALYEQSLGPDNPDTAEALQALGIALQHVGRHAEARSAHEQALAIRKRVLGAQHADTADSLLYLGDTLLSLHKPAEAEPHVKDGLAVVRRVHGEKHATTAAALAQMASLCFALGDYPNARRFQEQAFKIREEVSGKKHEETANAQMWLGAMLWRMGDYDEARRHLEQAVAVFQEQKGGRAATARALNFLGGVLQSLGDFPGARNCHEQALTIRRTSEEKNERDVAESLHNLGCVLMDLGDYAAARPHLEESLPTFQDPEQTDPRETVAALNNLGLLYSRLGDYAQARRTYEQALEIAKKTYPKNHPELASHLNNLAVLLCTIHDYRAARPYLEEALAIRKTMLGEKNPETALSLHNLAALLDGLGDFAAARRYYEQALAIRKQMLGETHPDTARSLNDLGVLLSQRMGEHAVAQSRQEQALAIYQALGMESNAEAELTLSSLAVTLAAQDEWGLAAERFDEARRLARRQTARLLPTLSEPEQLQYLQLSFFRFEQALSLGWQRRSELQARERSAEWLLNGKALAHEALAHRSRLAKPESAAVLAQLRRTRSDLARLSVQAPSANEAPAHRRKLDALRAQEDRLIRKVGAITLGAGDADPWMTLPEVREALDRDAVLINIARFGMFDFPSGAKPYRWGAARYVAWIIRPTAKGDIAVVDLGEAEALDGAVREVRQAIQSAPSLIPAQGEEAAEQSLRRSLEKLAALTLIPLAPHLGDAPRLVLSPDGQLWLAPWAALPLGDGRYAIEQYEISYLISGRELAAPQRSPVDRQPPLVIADPDFDASHTDVTKSNEPTSARTTPQDAFRSTRTDEGLPRFARLPGTALEAEAIQPSLKQYAGAAPQVYLGAEAQERAFKAVIRPQVLGLATHGFFFGPQQVARQEAHITSKGALPATMSVAGEPLVNPLLRCGLVLAGVNRRDQAPPGAEDGVLTGLEIVGADLHGTDLVVLSACETGVGEVRNGEGVAGLRQAFQLAGAEAVVASLWSVPDLETARLMKSFFEHLAAGKNKAAALRAAQLERITSRRDRSQAAHPYFWAAFTVTGR